MNLKKLKPVEGKKVFNPANNLDLEKDGETVPFNKYWRRRLKNNEVTDISEEKPVEKKTDKTSKETNKNTNKSEE